MIIDEDKVFPLSRYTKGRKIDSDHNTMVLYLNINYQMKKPDRKEFFNFKNKECQENFFQKTEELTKLSECFQNNNSLETKSNEWFRTLTGYFHQCFKKIRCKKTGKETDTDKLMMMRTELI